MKPDLWPLTFDYLGYTSTYKWWFLGLLMVGLVLGVRAALRQPLFGATVSGTLIVGSVAVGLHVVAAQTLLADPIRMPGGYQGPRVLDVLFCVAALLLPHASVFALGFYSPRLLRALLSWSRRPIIAFQLLLLVYAVWVSPWTLDIILD